MARNGSASTSAHWPSNDDETYGNNITHRGFKIWTNKLPILKAEPIEQMNKKLGITVPEMIFGENFASIKHIASGWEISFNTFDALDMVDKTGGSMLQVAHSKEWQSTRCARSGGAVRAMPC